MPSYPLPYHIVAVDEIHTAIQITTSKPSNSGGPRYVPSGARPLECAFWKDSDSVHAKNVSLDSHVE